MKRILPLLLLLITGATYAQVTTKALKASITLQMPRTVDDDMPGTRGASVVWHPLQKKYYAAMAGNIGYPLGVFSATGTLLSDETLNTEVDMRGMWYNPLRKEIEGNTYNDNGWFAYSLNAKGIPVEFKVILEGMNQPDAQCVGVFNSFKQQVLFLYAGSVYAYDMKGMAVGDPKPIQWGHAKKDGEIDEEELGITPDAYNATALVFTGIKGAELGFLNTITREIELYNMADGYLTRRFTLPDDATTNVSFNFAYANGMFWLFNMETRTWTSYK